MLIYRCSRSILRLHMAEIYTDWTKLMVPVDQHAITPMLLHEPTI